MEPEKQLIFGPFRLDGVDERLCKGNEEIRLTPKAFAVLKFLVEHPGRLLTKENLLEKLWPGVYVTEAALAVCINEIRKAIGDDSKEPTFIETVHRRGYRFIAPVTIDGQLSDQTDVPFSYNATLPPDEQESATRKTNEPLVNASRPSTETARDPSVLERLRSGTLKTRTPLAKLWSKRAWATAVMLLVTIGVVLWRLQSQSLPGIEDGTLSAVPRWSNPGKPSIAILAFANMTGDSNQEYFSDGISESIITRLARIPDLDVIARTSSFVYKDKLVDIKEVGRDLGVRYVLEGSAQIEGGNIRINAQLIDGSTGQHLWAQSYDRERKAIFAIQDEITLKVVKSLLVKLSRGETHLLTQDGTQNLQAWESAIRASWHANKVTRHDNARARELFQKSLEFDPSFALIYAKLGRTHFVDWRRGWSKHPSESFAKAAHLATKALSMDGTIASAYSLLARIHLANKEYEKAFAAAERSVSLAPNDPGILANCALRLSAVGRYEDSVRMMEKAMRLDPYDSSLRRRLLSRMYYVVGRYDDAISAAKKYIALNIERGQVSNRTVLVASLVAAGRQQEARTEAEQLLALFPEYSAKATVTGRGFFGSVKNQEIKEQLFARLLAAGVPE